MKARHAHSRQQSASPEPLTPSEEDVAAVDEREDVPTIFDGAVFQDDDDRLLWRLVWGIVWCASVLLVACFAAFPIALIIRGSPEPAMQASRPEEATAQVSETAAAPGPPGLGVQEGAFDELFGDLAEPNRGAVAFGNFPSGDIAPASEALRPQKSEFTPSVFVTIEAAAVPPEVAANLASEQGKALVLASPASDRTDAEAREADVLPSAITASRADPRAAAKLDSGAAQPSMSAMPAFVGVSAGARPAAATLARPPEVQSAEVQPALSAIRQAVAAPAGADLEHGADLPLASAIAGPTARVGLEAEEAAALPVTASPGFSESAEITPEIGGVAVQPSDRALMEAAAAPESAPVGQVPSLVAAQEIVASMANAVDRPPAALRAVREARVASVATPDAEPATDLETARTAAEPSSVATGGTSGARVADVIMPDAGRPTIETAALAPEPSAAAAGAIFEARTAEGAIPDADGLVALETAARAAEPSVVAVHGMSVVEEAEIAIPDADSPTAVEFAAIAADPSAAAAGAMFEIPAAEVATPGVEPTTALETAGMVAEPSASGVRGVSDVPVMAVAPLDAESTTNLEAAGTIAEPSAALVAEPAELSPSTDRAYSALAPDVVGAESDSPALDSRETSTVPAEAALPAPRLPRPRPVDAAIAFAPPDLPDPVERRPEPEVPRREPPAAAQAEPDSQTSFPVQAPPQASLSGGLALPPALLPLLPPRSSTTSGSVPN